MEVIWPATLCYCFPQLNLCLPLLLLLLSVDDEYYSGGTADIFDDEDEEDEAKAVVRVYKPETLVTRSFVIRSLCVS